ncbi:leucine-rich repeat-containing protein 56 [Centruroides vittatus]|uniref:leucine-rich repeat-containing protein 56 n=1 Tax=Centruroides vittatus TaxID=120091 RepID=UPI00350E9F10
MSIFVEKEDFLNFEKPYRELMRILQEDDEENIKAKLKQITKKESLEEIESLRIRINSEDSIVRRGSRWLPFLKILNLTGSKLDTLRKLGTDLKALEILIINDCGLNDLDGIENLCNLKTIQATDNNITDIFNCIFLDELQSLDLQNNAISKIEDIECLTLCNNLKSLNLLDNPICKILQSLREDDEIHKSIARQLLPKLQYIEKLSLSSLLLSQTSNIKSNIENI